MTLGSRYLAHVGFVTTPKYFDDSPMEFLKVAPERAGILQRVLHLPGYTYDLKQRAEAMDELEASALALAESHCDVVVQVGTNWVHAAGTDPDEIETFIDRVSDTIGVPFVMAGMAIVRALRAIGAETITVANSYYRPDWMAGINRFFEQAGFEILWSGNLLDQGIYATFDELLEVEAATLWNYPPDIVRRSLLEAHAAAPQADALVQTGKGFTTVALLDEVEQRTGTTVVASDAATYWEALRHLNLAARQGFGSLLDGLR